MSVSADEVNDSDDVNIDVEKTNIDDNDNQRNSGEIKRSTSFEDIMMARRRPSQIISRQEKKKNYLQQLTSQALDLRESFVNMRFNSRGSLKKDALEAFEEGEEEESEEFHHNRSYFMSRMMNNVSSLDMSCNSTGDFDFAHNSTIRNHRRRRGRRRSATGSIDNRNTNTAAFIPPTSTIRKEKENERNEKEAREKEPKKLASQAIFTTTNVDAATKEVKTKKEDVITINLTFPPVKPKQEGTENKTSGAKKISTGGILKTWWT